jgi:predicted Zn-dependent protease with MMP-like domain
VISIGRQAFEQLVADALDDLPEPLAQQMDNVVVIVEDRNRLEPSLLGLHEGIPLTDRDVYGALELPDVVTIYRLPLCEMCRSLSHLREQVYVTVVHELAHHFGIDDDRLTELGWD